MELERRTYRNEDLILKASGASVAAVPIPCDWLLPWLQEAANLEFPRKA
jgi:hypothetical protein